MGRAPANSEVRLSVHFWDGPAPVLGDVLETSRGRRYLIIEIKHKRDGALSTLRCIVLPPDADVTGTVFEWRWMDRSRRKT